ELHVIQGFDPHPTSCFLRSSPGRLASSRGPTDLRRPASRPPPIEDPPMIKFYYHPSPNPAKVALFLEESGLPYELMPVDTRKGEQFKPDFVKINPNSKTPALVDGH